MKRHYTGVQILTKKITGTGKGLEVTWRSYDFNKMQENSEFLSPEIKS